MGRRATHDEDTLRRQQSNSPSPDIIRPCLVPPPFGPLPTRARDSTQPPAGRVVESALQKTDGELDSRPTSSDFGPVAEIVRVLALVLTVD